MNNKYFDLSKLKPNKLISFIMLPKGYGKSIYLLTKQERSIKEQILYEKGKVHVYRCLITEYKTEADLVKRTIEQYEKQLTQVRAKIHEIQANVKGKD